MKDKKNLLGQSIVYAALVFIYVWIVGWFLFNAGSFFGQVDSFLAPVFMLLLFVLSATIVSGLMLGKPIMLYLENEKKQAVSLLGYNVFWLLIFTILLMFVLTRVQ